MSFPAHITVLYFAAASTTLGITDELVPIPEKGLYLSQLTELLIERHSQSSLNSGTTGTSEGDRKKGNNKGQAVGEALRKILDSSQWSIDAEMVDDEDLTKVELKDGMEVAVICPVSGG
ncbi:hypothetical protein F5890DRAFT_1488726 [Lentinula detonsa]|uniref:Molybdopterin synthase sulfur carrier subunit n=1 Tax=Lentinula detonsa TaxID=2804962 RepID=A0AA38Q761_9AGAR|nr:hypothetical protein F5890DRAFT_1488726 [Lentinula detonsa]